MGFMGTGIGGTDPLGDLVRGEEVAGFDHPLLARQPLGLMTPILLHLLLSNTDK